MMKPAQDHFGYPAAQEPVRQRPPRGGQNMLEPAQDHYGYPTSKDQQNTRAVVRPALERDLSNPRGAHNDRGGHPQKPPYVHLPSRFTHPLRPHSPVNDFFSNGL